MDVRKIIAVTALGTGMGFSQVATAQQAQNRAVQPQQVQVQNQVQGQNQAAQAGQRTQWQSTDQKLATCIAIGNQEEIALAKFAEEKAKNSDVKEFAQMLVKDHQTFLQKLQHYAPEASREGYLNENHSISESQRSNVGQQQARVQPAGNVATTNVIQQTAAVQGAEAHPLDFVALHRELAQECLRTSKQELNKKDRGEFDECFIGHQIAKHEEMKNKLVVFERHASGDLKKIFSEGVETTEKHLKKAEHLMKQLADSDSSNSKKDRSESRK